MHLDTNERSGADKWFGGVLDACRDGNLGEDDYNFIHGYPTKKPIRFWYHRRKDASFQHDETACTYVPYFIRNHWDAYPATEKYECCDCCGSFERFELLFGAALTGLLCKMSKM